LIDGERFDDFAGFVDEFNRVFCSRFDATWNGNLDAFHDYLNWPERRYRLVWSHSERSRRRLGYREMERWIADCLRTCHPTGVAQFKERLAAAQRCDGPTMFDTLVEIIRENGDWAELRLE
jgi:hypothetical protein